MVQRGLTESQWDSILDCALQFSANACQSIDNYVDEAFGERMRLDK